MTTLHLDTAAKSLSLTADLAGETSPIEARMKYTIEDREGRLFLIPRDIECSREWLSLLAAEYLQANPVTVEIPSGLPAIAAKILKL